MKYRIIISAIFTVGCLLFSEAQDYYDIKRMPFNTSSNSEMAPAFYKNGLVFSSNRKNNIILVTTDQNGNFLYNLYFVELKPNDKWTKPELLSKSLVTRFNESSASVSQDYKQLFYTSNNAVEGKNIIPQLKDTLKNGIFIASWGSDDWNYKEAFQFNSKDYDVAYPFITSDGKRLYFSARKPGGYGEFDIYYSDNNNNSWTEPVNLGPKINSSGSEVYPFLHKNNRLYFASNGHGGEGGLDIFYSELINGEWQQPVDMKPPFNSKYDDFALIVNNDFDTGFFTSNRRGTDDIYRFASTIPTFNDCADQVEEKFCYEFYEAGTVNLNTTSLKYEWDLGDGTKIRQEKVEHCYASPGYYLIRLNVIDTLTGETAYNQAAYDLNAERIEQPYISATDTGFVNSEISFDGSKSNIVKFKIQNYYWDFGDGTVGTNLKTSHNYLRGGTYSVRLGVTGLEQGKKGPLQKACVRKSIIIIEGNK